MNPELSLYRDLFDGTVIKIPHGICRGLKWNYTKRQSIHFASGLWDVSFQKIMLKVLKPGDVFYDVGANYGANTLVGAKLVGSKGRVYSFEPVKHIATVLKEQIKLNGLKQCQVVEKVLSQKKGKVSFFCHKDFDGLGSLEKLHADLFLDKIILPAITLDFFTIQNKIPHMIKIDVEGAEEKVLLGAQKLMSSKAPPIFLIELHTEASAEAVLILLKKFQYKIKFLEFDGDIKKLKIEGPIAHIVAWPQKH